MMTYNPAARLCRLSAEEFCSLASREPGSFYRPYSELLRMAAGGAAYGVYGRPQAAMAVLPLNANLETVAALRQHCPGWLRGGVLLTPPIGEKGGTATLLAALLERLQGEGNRLWAILDTSPESEALLPLYLQAGLALRAMRPLNGLAPCYWFDRNAPCTGGESVWLSMNQPAAVAKLLCRGWVAVEARQEAAGNAVRLVPPHEKKYHL